MMNSQRYLAALILVCLFASHSNADAPPTQDAASFNIRPNTPDDQTPAIQKYLDHVAKLGGGSAYLPPGQYTVQGSLRVPTAVSLAGSWETPHHGILTKGTVLLAYAGRGKEDGPALIELSPSSG